ncbi:O-methyltransferase [Mycobacterium tuberculosis]|nr:O-methyltransferase [Mycobacterium tuberculosis]CLM13588.1 O-methyltransferase [Mycobacterium tuberculosis]
MARNPAAQTAFGPMVLAAVEQNEPPGRRLVDDDLADLFLPRPLRWLAGATRSAVLRRLLISASEWSGRGLWANLACRKRFIGDKLDEALGDIDAVVILGAGLDTRAYRLTRRVRMPVFEVDLPVNIARKAKTVRRVLGELPLSVRLVALDFEHDDLLTALAEHGYYRVPGVLRLRRCDPIPHRAGRPADLGGPTRGRTGQSNGIHLRPPGLH